MKKIVTISALLLITLSSCDTFFNRHLIKGSDKRKEVHAQFEERLKLVAGYDSSIFKIINSELTTKEREGFEFLYAYMPLSDLAMHSPDYVLKNVQLALKAQKEFKWARKVPADIFLHFVLPYRVNNEYTDNAREVFFEELKERLQGLDAYQAALEVNYWCHEKVTYQSTDERTCGPLTAVRSAFGRCGEESTFAVAAYRSVGIPARQVYTPRWAHTDDNHAWVEIWVDGKWHFLGACEPEPELDRGWFAGPAKRAMMSRTFVFGKYDGPEERLNQTQYFTEINLMPNYAPIRKLTVTVTDSTGNPVDGAKVEYQLYNYAEFFPIATLQTNEKGTCTLTTGIGDLMIWAQKDNTYAFAKADRNQNDIKLTLKREIPSTNLTLTLTPPDEQAIPPYEEGKAEEHYLRIKQGNEIRSNYISTFIDSASAANLAMEKGISIDETCRWLAKSRGNWNEIYNFIKNLDVKDITVGMAMLSTLREKDLRDITADILFDHLSRVDSFPALLENSKVKEFDYYILSPRIGREFITPWRSFLQDAFTFEEIGFFRNNPQNIAQWIKEFVTLDTESNYYRVPLSPESVYRIRRADEYSMAIFFVAACRSFGIAARLEPASKKPQYFMKGKWIDVNITDVQETQATTPTGLLIINLDKNSAVEQPKYYTHFTIARFEKGKYITLDYEDSQTFSKFPATLELPEGLYRIITGNRHKSGTVNCNVYHIKVESGKKVQFTLTIPSTESEKKVLGSISTDISLPVAGSPITIGQITKKKPAIIAIIDPLAEPTRHLLRDISSLSSEFAGKGNGIALILARGKSAKADLASIFDGNPYPNTIALGNDINGEFEARVVQAVGKQQAYPIVFIVNNYGEIVYHSSGYSINLGEQLLSALKQ